MSHEIAVLNYLKAKGTITVHQAIAEFSDYRLASSINRLRGKGWLISTEIIRGRNKNGKFQYAKYKLMNSRRVGA